MSAKRDRKYRNLAPLRPIRRWQAPYVGVASPDGRPTSTDRDRGILWKLAVAWAAWESWAYDRYPKGGRDDWYRELSVPLVTPIEAPNSLNLLEWLDPNSDLDVEAYFHLREGSWSALRPWFEGEVACDTHDRAMRIGWALRNAIVHGKLSPSRARAWDLIRPVERFTEHVLASAAAA